MSDVVTAAVDALNAKIEGSFDSVAKFVLIGEGAIMLDSDGARAGDEEAEVVLTAEPDVFQDIITGELNATSAFMQGKLQVDGDMGVAMSLGTVLS